MQINDKDAGAYFQVLSATPAAGTAGGSGDNTEVNGDIVDMQALGAAPWSGAIIICGEATLAQDETLALNDVKIEHGDASDLADAADYEYAGFCAPADNAAVATGGTGGSTETIKFKQRINLQGVKRYWRVCFTPDCSASGTDTFDLAGCAVVIGEEAPLS
jgi:hypothetical protein